MIAPADINLLLARRRSHCFRFTGNDHRYGQNSAGSKITKKRYRQRESTQGVGCLHLQKQVNFCLKWRLLMHSGRYFVQFSCTFQVKSSAFGLKMFKTLKCHWQFLHQLATILGPRIACVWSRVQLAEKRVRPKAAFVVPRDKSGARCFGGRKVPHLDAALRLDASDSSSRLGRVPVGVVHRFSAICARISHPSKLRRGPHVVAPQRRPNVVNARFPILEIG